MKKKATASIEATCAALAQLAQVIPPYREIQPDGWVSITDASKQLRLSRSSARKRLDKACLRGEWERCRANMGTNIGMAYRPVVVKNRLHKV